MTGSADAVAVNVTTASLGNRHQAAILTIDRPPLNLLSAGLRRLLLDRVAEVASLPDLAGVVLSGANGTFVAGADIKEFDADPLPPHLTEVVAALEALPVPVVAAIDGAALGGGYEIALACDYRVCTGRSVVGLPEVTLGLIPGAGGTQKLPRLTGVANAIRLITSGTRVAAAEAHALGMIDEVVESDAVAAALAWLERAAGARRRTIALAIPASSPAEITEAERRALRRGRGAAAVAAAVTAIKAVATEPATLALANERRISLKLRRGAEARALRYLFFAERATTRPSTDVRGGEIRTVGVVGAGRMGAGIAASFATSGCEVRLADNDPAMLSAALARVGERGDPHLMGRIRPATLADLSECDLIVEAISENLDAKIALFRALDEVAQPHCILASNTSYLDVDAIAAATRRPGNVAGLHFFNPPDVMRLVEVVKATRATPATLETLRRAVRRLGKIPVSTGPAAGFIGNRLFSAYRRQCEFLIEDGSQPAEVDSAMRAFGMAMGPFETFDLAGLEIAWAARKQGAASRDPRARYVAIADHLCELGRFGRRTGRGWYRYDEGKAKPDTEVAALIVAESATKGIVRRQIAPEEIRARLLGAIVNEAALLLGNGTAQSPADVDLVLVHGYGFPGYRGGPLYWAGRQDRRELLDAVALAVRCSGFGAALAPNLEQVLDEAARPAG